MIWSSSDQILSSNYREPAQNHYGTVGGTASAMVLLGSDYWTSQRPVVALLNALAADRAYAGLIAVTDDVDDAVAFVTHHQQVEVPGGDWSFCANH